MGLAELNVWLVFKYTLMLVLKALDIDRSVTIYIAAGEIYGGARRMASLTDAYPNVVRKETLLDSKHVTLFSAGKYHFVDLDSKHLNKMHYYYRSDQKIQLRHDRIRGLDTDAAASPGHVLGADPVGVRWRFKDRMMQFVSTSRMLALARDMGSGSVDSSTGWIRYQMDSTNEESLQKGVERMLRIAAAAWAVEVGTHHCKGDRLNVKTANSHGFEGFVKGTSKRSFVDEQIISI